MTPFLLAISDSMVASVVVKATAVCTLGLLVAFAMGRSRASVRHGVLAAMFAVLLVLPMVVLFAPPLKVVTEDTSALTNASSLPNPILVAPAPMVKMVAPVPAQPRGVSAAMALLGAWGAGVVAFLVPMVIGLWQVRRLRRDAVAWTGSAELPRRVEVVVHSALAGPMACGVFRPAIILPRAAESWSEEDLTRALVHESEHVRRADLLTQRLARIVCAVYWFHPLVWIAWRRLVLEAERSCDDAVLAQSEATAYADQLVSLAERAGGRAPVLAMADRADLAKRVRSVLDGRAKRGRAGMWAVALMCVTAVILVCGVGPLKVVAAPPAVPPAVAPVFAQAPSPATPVRPAPVPTQGPAAQRPTAPDSALVFTTVVVRDSNGKAAEGLTVDRFKVTDSGVPQTIAGFENLATSDGLPNRYALSYRPENTSQDGGFHEISVTVSGGPWTIRTLNGYFLPALRAPVANPQIAQVQKVPVPPAPTVNNPLRFVSSTDMVDVTVTVRDANGNLIEGLNAANFAITEDGKPQTVAFLDFHKESDPAYYMLGYYATNQSHDGNYRRIMVNIVGRDDAEAIRYRQGYYQDRPIRYAVSDGMIPPTATYAPEAEYSEQARKAKWAGTVHLKFVVTESGNVANVVVLHPLGLGLDEKAIEALSKWKFVPATKNGSHLAVVAEMDMQFHLL